MRTTSKPQLFNEQVVNFSRSEYTVVRGEPSPIDLKAHKGSEHESYRMRSGARGSAP
jgi:hypothetical protein